MKVKGDGESVGSWSASAAVGVLVVGLFGEWFWRRKRTSRRKKQQRRNKLKFKEAGPFLLKIYFMII